MSLACRLGEWCTLGTLTARLHLSIEELVTARQQLINTELVAHQARHAANSKPKSCPVCGGAAGVVIDGEFGHQGREAVRLCPIGKVVNPIVALSCSCGPGFRARRRYGSAV